VVALVAAIRTFGSNTANNLDLPGTDSQAATDLLAERFPPQQNGSNPLVFHARDGKVTAPANETAIKRSRSRLEATPHVVRAPSPFTRRGASQVSDDRRTAFIPVLLDVGNGDLTEEIAASVLAAGTPARQAGLEVAVGGAVGS